MPNQKDLEKKSTKKLGLGRGLGSLLGEHSREIEIEVDESEPLEVTPFVASPLKNQTFIDSPAPNLNDHSKIWSIGIDKIIPNKNQPRKEFSPLELKELSASIKQKGILQPIVCRRRDKQFEIIAGERRWRAAQQAGLHEVPVILKDVDDQQTLELALIENLQRADLNPVEEAEAYQYLIDHHQLTQQALADRIGKERATVANVMRLLQLDGEVRRMVIQNELSLGQAKVLLAVKDQVAQRNLARQVRQKKMSVRQTEKLVQRHLRGAAELSGLDLPQKLAQGVAQDLQKILGTKVSIDYSDGKGKVSIYYYSDAELNQLIDRIKLSWQR